jgi:glycosyltransferase involved in cell wall biosynthesis
MSGSKRAIAVLVHPPFGDFAGGEMVAAWTLQVLQEKYDTILWSARKPDLQRMDERFGTKLRECPPMEVVTPPGWLAEWMTTPQKGKLLRLILLARSLLRLERRWRPVVWVGTCNETWLPKPGLQYIHWSENGRLAETPDHWPWIKRMGFRLTRGIAWQMALKKMSAPAGNRTVINSRWSQGEYQRKGLGLQGVLYPPVPSYGEGLPWAQRENRVVWLGRWHRLKRMDIAIDLVEQARNAGARDLRLAFAGFWHASDEEKNRLLKRCADLDWIEWHEKVGREELDRLLGSSRYGLHTMQLEHFGIAVAEMATAGCIVMVHDSGGPPEIVEDRRQIYTDTTDGSRKLYEIWSSPELQAELHQAARPRGLRFAPEVFCAALRQEIAICDLSGEGLGLSKGT